MVTDQKGHKLRHQLAGSDEISLVGLSGEPATLTTHKGLTTGTHGVTGTIVGNSDLQTLTNKTLDNTNTVTLKDTLFTLQNGADVSKQTKFQLSGITTATTRTLTVPDANTTIVGTDTVQTLTNKTILYTITTQTINYAILATDDVILANGTITVTLPTAVGRSGKVYTIKRINASGNVTINTTSSQTIDGSLTLVLASQNDSVALISDNSNWWII